MTLDILFLIGGLALLVVGGDVLVRGSVGLAERMGISTLIVGLTVVAFGTSAPELAVNLAAAISGRGDLSFGNIVGSNIANIGLILGISALVRPLVVHPSIIKRDIPIMLLASGLLTATCYDRVLYDATGDVIARGDGVILLMVFGMFLIFTIRSAMRERRDGRASTGAAAVEGEADADAPDPLLAEKEQEVAALKPPPGLGAALLLTAAGLAAVIFGGDLTVRGATAIATALGISEVIIGLTIVAVGTSLPELATSVMAVRAGHTDIAVGNVVGSNIWNILFILAVTAVIRPIGVPLGGDIDLWVMTGFALSLMPIALLKGQRLIGRGPGVLLLIAYAAYVVLRTGQTLT